MFPYVIPYPSIDPVLIEIGPLALRWYSLAYIAGILVGYWYAARLVPQHRLWPADKPPFARTDLWDLVAWATLGIVIGGRLGYVLFYNPAYYLENPLEILVLWSGGMSFHGGALGLAIAAMMFAIQRTIPVFSMLDVVAAAAPIGLFFGRIANFINGELYGRPADVPWAMVFPGAGPEPRHPSQLYEAALEGLLLFVALRILTHGLRSLRYPGLTLGGFLIGYGAARSFVELFRMPDAHIGFLYGGLTMGIVLSLPMVLAGIGFVGYALTRGRPGELASDPSRWHLEEDATASRSE